MVYNKKEYFEIQEKQQQKIYKHWWCLKRYIQQVKKIKREEQWKYSEVLKLKTTMNEKKKQTK